MRLQSRLEAQSQAVVSRLMQALELNSRPTQEQQALLTTEPSLQSRADISALPSATFQSVAMDTLKVSKVQRRVKLNIENTSCNHRKVGLFAG